MSRSFLLVRSLTAAVALLTLLGTSAASARKRRLDEPKAGAGLKEALSISAGNAVDILGKVDGYLGNAEVRIKPPKGLDVVAKALRALGKGALVEEFETSMNRAAEAAAPLAKEVFLDAIKDMSFSDALKIVKGREHEATDYLEEHSRERLTELFKPIISQKLEEVGATASFNRLIDQYATLPFMNRPLVDLEGHVTSAALDGMFRMIAKEEERIRTDVVARTTDLLREVFGGRRASSKQEGSSDTRRVLDALKEGTP